MPFIEDSGPAPARLPTYAPPPNPLRPSFSDTVAAGFLKSNPTVNVFRSQRDETFPPDVDGHDPLDVIRGTKYQERYQDRFIESRSKAETQALIGKIEGEEQTDRALEAAGWGGTLASIAGGTLDPTIALPAGQIYRNAKGGYALIKSGVSTGVAAGGQMAVQEAILQGSQSTRTQLESTTAIGSGVLLGGFIGAGAAALLSRAERGVLTRALDHERAAIDAHARGEPPPEPPRLEPATDRTAAIGRPEPTTPEQMAEIRARLDESSARVTTSAVPPEPASVAAVEPSLGQAAPAAAPLNHITPGQDLGGAIRSFIDHKVEIKGPKSQIDIGEVTNGKGIMDAGGLTLDPTGWRVTLDSDALRHAARQRGLSMAPDDIARIPEIVSSPDKIEGGPRNAGDRKRYSVQFTKRIGDQDVTVVLESLKTKKELRLKTMFKDKVADVSVPGEAKTVESGIQYTPGNTAVERRPGVWANADHDIPVTILDKPPLKGNDGRMYQQVEFEGKPSFVPADEIRERQVGADAMPDGLSTWSGPSSSLREKADPRAHEIQIRDASGQVHYRGEITQESGDLWGVGFIENVSRKYSGLAERLYVEMAKYAESQGGRLIAGMNTNRFSDAVLKRLEEKGLATKVQIGDRELLQISPGSVGEAAAEGGSALPQSGGAAAADSRRLEMVPYGLGWTSRISPTRYVVESSSVTARRDMADLASLPYRFKDNIPVGGGAPIATTQGPPLDILAGMAIKGTGGKISDDLGRLYGTYRFGDPDATAPRLRGNLDRVLGRDEGMLTYTEFKKEVSRAMITGDRHSIPEVAQGAQTVREVFNTWLKRAQEAKILPEDIDVKTAESYLHRVYNKEAIRANEPGFVKTITDWLQADQSTKRATQGRLFDLIEQRNKVIDTIEKSTSEAEIAKARLQHDTLQTKIEREIAAWDGTSVASAQKKIKAAEQAAADRAIREAEKLGAGVEKPKISRTQALRDAVDKAVEKILKSDRELSLEELQSKAHEIKDRVLGTPDGRLPYDIDSGGPEIGWRPKGGEEPRGPLAKREFNIPDKAIWDYLEQDIEKITATHLRTVVPDVLLTEKFGDVRMTESLKNILDDYNARIAATKSKKGQAALVAEREGVMERMVGVRDRLRGVYGWSANSENMGRIANAAKMLNNITTGGMFAVASLADFAGAIFRHGFGSAMADGWHPYIRGLMNLDEGAFKEFKSELRAIGIGIDVTTNARQHAVDDVLDTYRPQSKVERALAWVNDKTFIANFLSPLTDMQKQIAGHAVASNIIRYSKAAAEGKATKEQLTKLAEANIDVQMAGRIWEQFQTAGEHRNGVYLPNTADWTSRDAANAFNGAMYRDVDIAVVTPGQEKPLFLSTVGGSVLGQFKTFTSAATERILIANLQRRDATVLQGLVAAMALGAMSYKINGMLGGVKTSDRPQDWVKESISRSGVTGWFEEANALASKSTRGGVDIYRMLGADHPLSRYSSRSTLDQLLGPTAGKVESVLQITGALGAKITNRTDTDWTASDTKAVRKLTAWQNMIWLRGAFNQVEEGINGRLGVEVKH